MMSQAGIRTSDIWITSLALYLFYPSTKSGRGIVFVPVCPSVCVCVCVCVSVDTITQKVAIRLK